MTQRTQKIDLKTKNSKVIKVIEWVFFHKGMIVETAAEILVYI